MRPNYELQQKHIPFYKLFILYLPSHPVESMGSKSPCCVYSLFPLSVYEGLYSLVYCTAPRSQLYCTTVHGLKQWDLIWGRALKE
jgi:hypothetical protein